MLLRIGCQRALIKAVEIPLFKKNENNLGRGKHWAMSNV